MTNSRCHSRVSGNPDKNGIWMPAFPLRGLRAGMTRFFLILALLLWGLMPCGGLFAAQSDSLVIKVKVIDSGQLIDPAVGGEVFSADGKAKLIIPPNAFSGGPVRISIIPIDITELQSATPQDYKLIVAVRCEPAGLQFTKPVELTLNLNEAEVPGTILRLAQYDAAQNTFITTGRTSPVAADGWTLTFTLGHFSTYGGLASMLSQGAPIGAGVKIPLPDMLTGAFGHSIPITVPPGRKGLQPNISLQYRSSSANSWVGMGWSINPGYIIRSTKLGPPTYDDTKDTFIFATDSGSTELVHLIGNLYQAKIESSFAKFYKETGDSWRVVQKDGSVLKFGQNADSKEAAEGGTFLWNLTKVTDVNSNYIELNYTKDQGKSYLYYIEYTGNENTGDLPQNRIDFIPEDRNDASSNFISGSEVKLAKRLSGIEVRQQGELVWRYGLAYEYSPNTKRSLLKSITQYTSDGKALPTQTFKYQRVND